MTKVEMLQSQSKSMAIVASYYTSTYEIYDVFLVGKVEINNEYKKIIKINNLKAIDYVGVVSKEEFKTHVKYILDMQLEVSYHPCAYGSRFWSPTTIYVRSICLFRRKLMNINYILGQMCKLGLCGIKPFHKTSPFLFSPPIPHSTYILKLACILLYICTSSWSTFDANSHHLILHIISIFSLI